MQVFSIAKGFHYLSKRDWSELTEKERNKLRAVLLLQQTRQPLMVCNLFGISKATLYRWQGSVDLKDPATLKEKSRRPKRLRKPLWEHEQILAVRDLRNQYPRWGKDKLTPLLRQQGIMLSASTVGRILSYLKGRGELRESPRRTLSVKRKSLRPYAVRKPRDYKAHDPGDLVQLDTLDVRPVAGVVLKQFTARDVVSKWDVIEVHHRATALTAKVFIETLRLRMPFPIRAIQVDGGSEFYSEFELACRDLGIKLYVLPPKSPKLNGSVERANRTHTEEFYEVVDCAWTVSELNPQLIKWEYTYNCIRPHAALNLKSPLQFLIDRGIMVDTKPLYQSHMY
jgi:putative transposase